MKLNCLPNKENMHAVWYENRVIHTLVFEKAVLGSPNGITIAKYCYHN
jgi:hypothetical protein